MPSDNSRTKWYNPATWFHRNQDQSSAAPQGTTEPRPAAPAEDKGSDNDTVDVEQVIQQVKRAIVDANLSKPHGDLIVTRVGLQLSVVRKRGGGIDATWQVPVINKDVGGEWERKWTSSNTIDIALKPPDIAGAAQGLMPDISSELAVAIALIRSTVKAGAEGQPPFELGEGTVELIFGVSSDGSITLLGKGEAGKATSSTLKLSLGSPAAHHGTRPQSRTPEDQSRAPEDGA